jgi:hypothetical protein
VEVLRCSRRRVIRCTLDWCSVFGRRPVCRQSGRLVDGFRRLSVSRPPWAPFLQINKAHTNGCLQRDLSSEKRRPALVAADRITCFGGIRLRPAVAALWCRRAGGAAGGLARRAAQSVAAEGSCRNTVSVTLLRQRSAGRR